MERESCAVCFEEYQSRGELKRGERVYACAHVYCAKCTVQLRGRRSACPLCRSAYPALRGAGDWLADFRPIRLRARATAGGGYDPRGTMPAYVDPVEAEWRQVEEESAPRFVLRAPPHRRLRAVGTDLTPAEAPASQGAERVVWVDASLQHALDVVRRASTLFNRVDLVDVDEFRGELERAVGANERAAARL
jgi:hypothetical protein